MVPMSPRAGSNKLAPRKSQETTTGPDCESRWVSKGRSSGLFVDWKMDPDWRCIFPIENGGVFQPAMLVDQWVFRLFSIGNKVETCQEHKIEKEWGDVKNDVLIPLMAEILHHLGGIKHCKQWDELPINWWRISAINSIHWDSMH